jgi:hypothetical protein
MVTDEMAISSWSVQTYTAATIAFTARTLEVAGTITDTALQFVIELFKADMHIKTNSTVNPGPFKIATAAAGTLTLISTDVVTAAVAGANITITSLASYADLPSDFWGFIERPYINTYQYTLAPIPNQDTKLLYINTSGTPIYYDLVGSKMYLYPETSADITINGKYWKKPATISRMDETLPYDELFDDAIQEVLVQTLNFGGLIPPEAQAALDAYLFKAVDLIGPHRHKRVPAQMPRGIAWEDFM